MDESSLAQMLKEAWRLKKVSQNDAALNLLLDYSREKGQFPNPATYGLAFSLMRKCGRTDDAQRVYEAMPAEFRKDAQAVQGFEWIVYDRVKATADASWQKKAEWLYQHATEGQYSPRPKIVWHACYRLWKEEPKQWQLLGVWLDRENPETLNKEANRIKVNQQDRLVASDYENWHYWKLKTLFHTGQYDEVIRRGRQFCETATVRLYYANFIQKLIAEAYMKNGEPEKAIQTLKSSGDDEWFTHLDLAVAYEQAGQTEEANEHALKAIVGKGARDSKVNAYRLMARLLMKGNQNKELVHDLLRAHIMCRNHYQTKRSDPELKQLAEKHGLNMDEEMDDCFIAQVIGQCERLLKRDYPPAYRGTIERILDIQQIGFVHFDDFQFKVGDRLMDSAVFSLRDLDPVRARSLAVGQTIMFDLRASFDKKKNRPSCTAYNLRVEISSGT